MLFLSLCASLSLTNIQSFSQFFYSNLCIVALPFHQRALSDQLHHTDSAAARHCQCSVISLRVHSLSFQSGRSCDTVFSG